MYIATLIAPAALRHADCEAAVAALNLAGCGPTSLAWIDEGDAADIGFAADPAGARAAIEGLGLAADVAVQVAADRDRRLIVADMDSTMITVECIDELADYAGIKPQIAEVTERAMRGELDFEAALDARVALLKGLDEAVIDRCRAERVRQTPGAATLIRTFRAMGGYALLVSGGFTRFAEPVAQDIGFDAAIANVLDIAGGALAGTVSRPIVDAARKRAELAGAAQRLGIDTRLAIGIGDGANDIPMIESAGLGIAFRAKPKARAAADATIDHGDLTAVLYMMGVPKARWVQ